MNWSNEGYLLSKNNYDENSIIIESFTMKYGKYTGIVYGGSSRKLKKIIQVGNKMLFNWNSKGENKSGYFSLELINPISPFFFDDKKKSISILASTSMLKILLPERQANEIIYESFDNLMSNLNKDNWIKLYIEWELSLIKELGFESKYKKTFEQKTNEALKFNRQLFMENFIIPNKLRMPNYRLILEKYFY
tara:strand:- start:534 stop:1109 length:576 start_codon:yes stop_codon:yes gene_type:complete